LTTRGSAEPPVSFITWPVLIGLRGVRRDHALDHRIQLTRIGHDLLLEMGVGPKAGVADVRERGVECRPRDLGTSRDELRQLARIDTGRVDAGRGELVGEHVRRLFRVGACCDHGRPERVEPAGDEHVGVVERERPGETADSRSRELADLAAQTFDELGRGPDRDQVRFREVAVVLCLLLGTERW